MSASATIVAAGALLLVLALIVVERGGRGAKEVALVATLGAVAAAGRVVLVPLPGVQPVTTMCVATGAALGARAGLAVGPLAALISNGFLGIGPWTPAQMGLWAGAGLAGAALRPLCRRAIGLAAVSVVCAIAFQAGIDLWTLATFGPEVSWPAFTLLMTRGIPFAVAHAAGAALMALAVGPAMIRLLERYARRIRVDVVSAPPAPVPAPAGPAGPPPPGPGPRR